MPVANGIEKQRSEGTREGTRGGNFFQPPVDIFETENELTLYADVPGVKSDDVELRFENGELILQARPQPHDHNGQTLLQEYEEGSYYRVFQIHESIDPTRIEAECKNGVLTPVRVALGVVAPGGNMFIALVKLSPT
jgi:HSP20 family protein